MKPELVWLARAVALPQWIAVVANKTGSTTLLGAQLLFWGRLAYAVVFIAGIPWLRTAVWAVAVVGLVLIFVQLL